MNFALWAGLKQKGQDCHERVGIQLQEICFINDKSGDNKGLKKRCRKELTYIYIYIYIYKKSAYGRIVKNGE